MKLTKIQLLKLLSPYTKRKDILNAIFLEMNKALVRKEDVLITSFGIFKVVQSRVKYGQDFHTKERILLKPKFKVKFYPSRVIERIINERNQIEPQ